MVEKRSCCAFNVIIITGRSATSTPARAWTPETPIQSNKEIG